VDEDSPCQPTRPGGWASLAAERLLETGPWADRAIVLRLAGIYGPARLPRAADLLAGRPLDADPGAVINLIHVEDAARIVIAVEAGTDPPRRYVVADGEPVVRGEFYSAMARLLGADPPRFAPSAGSAAENRREGNKRVHPRRLFADLAISLRYPSYREGLQAILAGGEEQKGYREP
jgi:nucleoside-diphosphate-sugar epimerase